MIDVNRLQPGDPLAEFTRRGSFQAWTRFAAVNYEIADHHMSASACKCLHNRSPNAMRSA